jgi:protein-L-isoaspartate(D-aspartate) O-methyltransferase
MDYTAARAELIKQLSAGIKDKRVLDAMVKVPREMFVPFEVRQYAYEDRPLSIGHGQTISQPYIVAIMTEALSLSGRDKVLEIGTGSGYQTAILAQLAGRVITTERVPELVETSREVLDELGCKNVAVYRAGDRLGWPGEAPYDAIMVTAAAPKIPEGLLKQLKVGGRLVIPVGSIYEQQLCRVIRKKTRNYIKNLGGCRFVPLIGREAWTENRETLL